LVSRERNYRSFVDYSDSPGGNLTIKNKIHKVLNFVVIPIATTLTFDLTLQRRILFFFVLAAGSILLNGAGIFIVACWQSFCVTALVSLFFSFYAQRIFSLNLATILFLIFLSLIVLYKRKSLLRQEIFHCVDLKRDCVASLSLSLSAAVTPRGDDSKFSFILAEDNEGWIRTPLSLLRNNHIDLSSSFDTTSIQYFVNFSLGLFARIFGASPGMSKSDQSTAVHIVASSWSFLWVSGILFVLLLTSDFSTRVIGMKSSIFLYSIVGLFQLAFFRASLLYGHYAQWLLNVVVFTFMVSMVEMVSMKQHRRPWTEAFIALAVALAMVGSYNPWIAITLGSLFLVVNSLYKISLISQTLQSKHRPFIFLFTLGVLIILYRALSTRYGRLEDGGGVWIVGPKSLWLSGVFLLLIPISFKVGNGDFALRVHQIRALRYLVALGTMLVMSLLIRDDFSFREWLPLFLLVGLILSFDFFDDLGIKVFRVFRDKTYLPILSLFLGTYFFILYVWLASRLSGPIYEPMYAAHKSLLTLSGQFFWIILCIAIFVPRRRKFVMRLRNPIIALALLNVSGIYPLISSDHSKSRVNVIENFGGDWWVAPTLQSYSVDPDAFIACVNGDWTVDDISVYNCNRFSSSLSVDGELANSFRYLAWKQKESYSALKDQIALISSTRNVVVISNGVMTPETRALFDRRIGDIEFIEVAS